MGKKKGGIQSDSRKGQKGMRGIAYNKHGEVKEKISISLIPSLIRKVEVIAKKRKVKRSAFIEELLMTVLETLEETE